MCLNPIKIRNPKIGLNVLYDAPTLTVPCNHCYQCQSAKQYDLEIRSVSEFEYRYKKGGAVYNYTLTYNDENVPKFFGVNVLKRRDMQLFIKRLQKRYPNDNLQVQYCGEYGKEKDRPHWHILIYSDSVIDPAILYHDVILSWSILTGWHYVNKKRVNEYTSIGYVGLPTKWLDGHKLPYRPENAILSSVDAIRYCVKYTFKSYNFYQSLIWRFRQSLNDLGVSPEQHFDFVFPPDPEFGLASETDLRQLCNHFSHCFRNPIGLGMHQQDYLDDKFDYRSFLQKTNGEYLQYPISQYLKNKLFHMSCVYDKDNKETRKSKIWLKYMQNTFEDSCLSKANYYLCNQNIEIYKDIRIDDNIKPFHYVKDILNYITTCADCNLRDYIRWITLCRHFPFLSQYPFEDIPRFVQSRTGVSVRPYIDTFLSLDSWLSQFDSLLLACKQSIAYAKYIVGVDRYNDRQSTIALEYQRENRGYKPRYIDKLPFHKFINLSNLSKEDVKTNY